MSLSRLPAAAKELLRTHLASNIVTKWKITGVGLQSAFTVLCTAAKPQQPQDDQIWNVDMNPDPQQGWGSRELYRGPIHTEDNRISSRTMSPHHPKVERQFSSVQSTVCSPSLKPCLSEKSVKTTMGQTCILVCVLVLLVISVGLTLTGLMTDNWYRVHTSDNINPDAKKAYNFHFGLWRLCYDDMPSDIAADASYKKDGSCIYIYEQLIQKNEDELDSDSRLRIHLSRTVLGCCIAAAAMSLAALISLLCGLCPLCSCKPVKRPCLYLSVSVVLLLATMCGITSGICFIALRDLDNSTKVTSQVLMPPANLPEYVSQEYFWSFMLHWIATGFAFIGSFLLLFMMRNSYEFVGEDAKFNPYGHI